MTYDVFTYNGEVDILKLRFNILGDLVDKFIIVEAKTTFTGNKKPLYFFEHEQRFKKWWKKIHYHVTDERYTDAEYRLAATSPNTIGAEHWKNEFLQKERIKQAINEANVQDEDTVYIGDVDEIWEPYNPIAPAKLKLRVYAYYLNNRSDEEFWGTICAKWGHIKHEILNHVRSDPNLRTQGYYGWHFTSMGGVKEVQRKLNDSYTTEDYNTMAVQQALPQRIERGADYLGRSFNFKLETNDWPMWLKVNLYDKKRYPWYNMCKDLPKKRPNAKTA